MKQFIGLCLFLFVSFMYSQNTEVKEKSNQRLQKDRVKGYIFKSDTVSSMDVYKLMQQLQLPTEEFKSKERSIEKIESESFYLNDRDFGIYFEQIQNQPLILESQQQAQQQVQQQVQLQEQEQMSATAKSISESESERVTTSLDSYRSEDAMETQTIIMFAQEAELLSESESEKVSGSKKKRYFIYKGKKEEKLKGPSDYDSRIEILELDSNSDWQKKILTSSQSVGVIVEKEKLLALNKDTYQINSSLTLKDRYNVCEDVPFNNQVLLGEGTAFVKSNITLLTAKHVFTRPPSDYVVIFEYYTINKLGEVLSFVDKKNTYNITSVSRKINALDIVEFEVDRSLDRAILPVGNSRDVQDTDEIYMLGYPLGLPMKLTINARIINDSQPQYFYTDFDSFAGNSGSPVLNLTTNKVIGVLVSGIDDFTFNGNCFETVVCADVSCFKEKVIRIEEIMKYFD
ncbi:trypsin-like peptidase [Nonlabens xylanidelens]|uniref:Trypsin-like peptidase n=1 Tax=Nonlabens xylanidelens TaxID=191564 RepID=A0A2S6IF08_9FLAO|nr:serine protease [Nonlabens xylanidelens]PPK92789.1 trypsin-like peptidase [Nonlabens xylanidelens]PQJ19833.1 hypothetical protein BST94_06210 [Nonlabens xylanidelens]